MLWFQLHRLSSFTPSDDAVIVPEGTISSKRGLQRVFARAGLGLDTGGFNQTVTYNNAMSCENKGRDAEHATDLALFKNVAVRGD